MTIRFRINSFTLDTTEGEVSYEFASDLTVLAGPTGVGKTTLLELIRFSFGGDARLAPVAEECVNSVTVDVTLGDSRLLISRSLDIVKRRTARITDVENQVRLSDHNVGAERPSLNSLILSHLGFPDDLRAAARGNSTREGNRVSFADIFTYLYIPQYEINRDIARSQDSYLEPKRKVVFELLFDLTDPDILAMHSRVNKLKKEIEEADLRHRTVFGFLRESGTTGRMESERTFQEAEQAQHAAERELRILREAVDPVSDRRTQVLRDLLAEAERSLADARADAVDLSRRHAGYATERRRVMGDLDRLARMRDAGARMANIEFKACPRCMQSLSRKHVHADVCRVCLQPDPIISTAEFDQYESRQLTAQLDEMGAQLDSLELEIDAMSSDIADRERLVMNLTGDIEARTAERVTPRLQTFSDASERMANAKAQQANLEGTLRQWDIVTDLEAAANALRAERETLRANLVRAEDQLKARRMQVIDEISEEFKETVEALGIPGVESAAVDPEKYLPVLNGKIFSKVVQVGGGMATATQVAYWTSLLAVALRRRDTHYPTFLMIDSPRLALNTATELTAALYRRLVTLVDANPGRVQFIIADNELPVYYRGDYAQIDFDYPDPTIATIEHPGLASVVTIDEPAD